MARHGKFDDYKTAAYELWQQRLPKTTIAKQLGIPRSTLIGWCKAWTKGVDVPTAPPAQKPTPQPLKGIDGGKKLTKFQKTCQILERIMCDPREGDAVRVQAANAMLRAIALEAELPKDVIHGGSEGDDLKAHVKATSELSDQELAQEYKELLART